MKKIKIGLGLIIFLCLVIGGVDVCAVTGIEVSQVTDSQLPWWVWSLVLLIFTFLLGVIAVVAGVGGGVLFVPIIGGFFPFHLDFVRGAGVFVALVGALSASPNLLKKNLVNLRLALPAALIDSSSAIIGAMIGLALPINIIQILLGIVIIFVVIIMVWARKSDFPNVAQPDALAQRLKIMGVFREESLGKDVKWCIHRTLPSLAMFIIIGFMAGMFGFGASWANIPVLNLMMGAPLKIAVATSKFLLCITDTSAAWVYLNKGAILPIIVVPSIVGMMVGSKIGVKILIQTKSKISRMIVILLLLFAGLRILLKGVGIWN